MTLFKAVAIGVVVWLVICVIIAIVDTKTYNHGKCTRCGGKFKLFDYDSQGGRGYICDKCRRTIWVSMFFVDR